MTNIKVTPGGMNANIGQEPKRRNKFIVELEGTSIEPWAVTKADRPTFTLENGWEDMSIEMVDFIGPSTSQKVFDGIINKMENRLITIKMVDPTNTEIEKWTLTVDYLRVDFGDVDYNLDFDDISTIKIDFKVISCKLN